MMAHIIGLRPFVLIETVMDDSPDGGFTLNLRGGSGVDTVADMVILLILALENLTGVPLDDYAKQVDAKGIKIAEVGK